MKTNRRNAFLGTALGTFIFTHTAIQAQISTWNGVTASLANGAWGTVGNWTANGVPNSATAIALLTKDWTGTGPTFTLGADRTLNGLEYEDTGTGTDVVGAINATNKITMAGTTPYVNTTNSFTFNNVLAGTAGLKKIGAVTLTLTGTNTISGDLNVDAGVVATGSAAALGTMAVNFTSGDTGRVAFGGGFTYTNPITVGTGVTGTSGSGLITHTNAGGVATLSGTITLSGLTGVGGVIYGSNTVGQELRFNGAINGSGFGLSQRDGRVIYAGGGTASGGFVFTGTAIVGANNGIPQNLIPQPAGSGSATLDLNGFNQTLAALNLGNSGSSFTSTVNLGAGTLTLNGNITSLSATGQNVSHVINATAGSGTLNVGSTNRAITLTDTLATNDLTINNARITGTGGLTKAGLGNLVLNNVTATAPITLTGGSLVLNNVTATAPITLSAGSLTVGFSTSNTLSPPSLSLASGTTLKMDVGTGGDLITSDVTSAGATLNINQYGGALPVGIYPILSYTGATPGLGNFTATANMGHATGSLKDTGTAIAYEVTANDTVYWTGGGATTDWSTTAADNWKLTSDNSAALYISGDEVTFPDAPTGTTVTIPATVTPAKVTFSNATGTNYTLSGTAGIAGTTGLTKTADGLLTINTPNAYTGSTTINSGSVIANFTAGTAIPSASAISVALGSSLTLRHDGGTFALNNPSLTGAGTVTIDPGFITAGNRDLADVTWDASTFTGPLNLAPTTGTMRIAVNNTADIGSGPITAAAGGQLFVNAGNLTIPNNITITGTGYNETTGTLGAIRANNPTTFTGTINVKGSAKIGALGGTAVISNLLRKDPDPLVLTGDLTFGGSINNGGSETLAITGDASGLTSLTVNDGSATSGAASMTVSIGNGTTTGTIGTVPVFLKADGFKNAVLRYDRADGHTLVNSITSAPTALVNEVRNYVDFDCTGTGFNDNGATITLGAAAPASGGTMRIGQARANALATLSGTLTGERFWMASAQNNATLNLGSTAVLKFNAFNLSESANNSATVNHPAGANVEVVGQLRVSHYGTNTSTYNLSGGTLTLSGDSPNNTPSTAASGGNGTNGDNNLNTLATQAIVGGGIYLGNDGTGIMNHTGGTVTTNWMVLDNRGASGPGVNMPDGIDRYNLSGSSILNLRSTWGLIGRNDGSYDVSLGGGTIRVDDTGTGTGTGPNITVPIDAILSTVASTTLDTNAAVNTGNAFTLTKNVNGTGTLALTGGGTVNLSTTGFQNIAANLTSSGTPANLVKLGTGTTTLAGSMTGFTGNVTVSAGRLNVPASLNTAVTVEAAGTLSGEVSLTSLTLNGGKLLFDPNSPGSLSATSLVLNGDSLLDVSAAPGGGVFPALTFGSVSGDGTLAVTNAADYRVAPIVSPTSTSPITVTFAAGAALTWTGTANSTWKIAGDLLTESNWNNSVPAADLFYSSDSVTFPDGPTATVVALTGLLAPAGVNVTSETANYTFTSTTGNQLTGSTGITKSGASTLALVGPNAYNGVTSINGGTISIAADSLGSGAPGNSLSFSNGGKLSYTGAVAANLGVNRSIAVGTGGGILEHNNAAAATITIPGALSGSEALTIQSVAAGGGTVALTGNNAGYTGPITVNSNSAGLTTLRIDNTAASPGLDSSITLNYPAAGATGNNTTLTLSGGTILPATTTVHMTSKTTSTAPPAVVSLRTQILSTGAVTINGPVKLTGDSIIQVVPPTGSTVTINGDITEASLGSFVESPFLPYSNVLFLRGVGTDIINGKILLPSAGSTVAVTDGATVILNGTGNDFRSAAVLNGTLRNGSATAIPSTARLVIGQGSNDNCTLDLNGFDQTVTDLVWSAPTPTINKGVSNSHPTATSTFTINQLAAPAANFSGTFKGAINLVKDGPATTTLSTFLSTFTGNVTVEEGQLTVAATHNDTNANSALGVTNVGTRSVTVKNAATLAFTGNDNLGNATSSPIMPIIVEAGGILTTAGFNTMGPITLNGGTMTATAGANTTSQAYRLFGTVSAGGTVASVMSASGTDTGYHLHSITAFDVANATGDPAADLTVSAPLINQSGTQAGAAGNLVKAGTGKMVLGAVNLYTGNTTVNAGTLELADNAQLRFVIGATSGTNNSISGSGTAVLEGDFAIDTTAATALSAGTWTLENVASLTGPYGINFRVVNTDGSPWAVTGETWTKTVGSKIWTFDEATGVLTLSLSGFNSWADANGASGQTPDQDHDLDGTENGVEYFMGATGSTFTANPALTGGSVSWPKSALFNGTYRVETSPDLVTWTNVTGAAVDNGSSVTYTLPTGDPKLFVHLVVIPN
jgi:autotransporter-associated beta strand protein